MGWKSCRTVATSNDWRERIWSPSGGQGENCVAVMSGTVACGTMLVDEAPPPRASSRLTWDQQTWASPELEGDARQVWLHRHLGIHKLAGPPARSSSSMGVAAVPFRDLLTDRAAAGRRPSLEEVEEVFSNYNGTDMPDPTASAETRRTKSLIGDRAAPRKSSGPLPPRSGSLPVPASWRHQRIAPPIPPSTYAYASCTRSSKSSQRAHGVFSTKDIVA